MARINIEDSIYKDERFHRLSAFEGKYKAIGLLVAAWDLAHTWYLKHPENLVPFAEWRAQSELELLEKYGLAEAKENGIYVKGSQNACSYLKARSEAGKRGALKTNEILHGKPQQAQQNTPSFSSSSSKENTNTLSRDSDESLETGADFNAQDLVDLWNETKHPNLPSVLKLTDARRRKTNKAIKDYPHLEFWRELIQMVNQTPFLLGEGKVTGDRSKAWRCDFDFIVNKDNAVKIIEGKYL